MKYNITKSTLEKIVFLIKKFKESKHLYIPKTFFKYNDWTHEFTNVSNFILSNKCAHNKNLMRKFM